MKQLLTVLVTVILIFACKKETIEKPQECLPDMKGIWIGKWGENFDTHNNNYLLHVKANNVVDVDNGFAVYVGTWRIDDYTFVASYIINGETLTLKSPVSKTHMEGIWRNVTTNEYKGTFYLDKQ